MQTIPYKNRREIFYRDLLLLQETLKRVPLEPIRQTEL